MSNSNAARTLKGVAQYRPPSPAVPACRPGNSSNGSITGHGYEDLDLSFFKNASLGSDRNLQFRFESFNTNVGTIRTSTSATNYGQITAAGAARVLQIAAKNHVFMCIHVIVPSTTNTDRVKNSLPTMWLSV